MAGARSAVLNLYKRLHRTSQSVFAGDTRMIEGARAKIKEDFWKNRNVTSAGALKELMQVGEDSIKVLRTSVIQAVATDTVDPQTGKPIYRARVSDDHLVTNAPFQDDISDEEYAASVRAHKKKARMERQRLKEQGLKAPPESCDS